MYAEVLEKFVHDRRIRTTSADTYLSCMRVFGEYLVVNGIGSWDGVGKEAVIGFFRDRGLTGDYRQFIKYVSALQRFEINVLGMKNAILYGDTATALFQEARRSRGKRYEGGGSGMAEGMIERKVNALRNEKMKLALRLGLRSGLRVSELAALAKEDLEFTEEGIRVNVSDGKGGKQRSVACLKDEYLTEKLKRYTAEIEDQFLFYSASYMKSNAAKLGFQMHDLRRSFSKRLLRESMAQGMTRAEAKAVVRDALGHNLKTTTDIYLRKKKGGVAVEP